MDRCANEMNLRPSPVTGRLIGSWRGQGNQPLDRGPVNSTWTGAYLLRSSLEGRFTAYSDPSRLQAAENASRRVGPSPGDAGSCIRLVPTRFGLPDLHPHRHCAYAGPLVGPVASRFDATGCSIK